MPDDLIDGKLYYVPLTLVDMSNKKEFQEKLADVSK